MPQDNREAAAAPSTRRATPVLTFAQARGLVAKYGSPLQVVSRQVLVGTLRTFQRCLPGAAIAYAVKANRDATVLTTLRQAGGAVEVCSTAELRACMAAGFQPQAVLHTHPCKTRDNLNDCHTLGVRRFTFDSVPELDKLAARAPDAELHLRVAEHSSADLDLSKKFGCDHADAMKLLDAARARGLKVVGLAFHIGSQCLKPEDFDPALANTRRLFDAARRARVPLTAIDIGGGPPAPYRDPAEIMGLEPYLRRVWRAVVKHFGDYRPGQPGGLHVIAEPGRGMVAECVTAVCTVLGRSERKGKWWYYLDDGVYGTFSGQFFGKNIYPVLAENAARRGPAPCVLAGPTCDSMDVIDTTQPMPHLALGELLLVPTVGAYSAACATDFNGLEPARTVTID